MAPRAVRGALLLWALALCCLSGAGRPWSGSHEWKKLILTQLWPPTLCQEVNDCEKSLDYWTIHGLWQASNRIKSDEVGGAGNLKF